MNPLLQDKIHAFSEIDSYSGCRVWKGTINKDGYGQFTYKAKTYLAHRAAYEAFKDAIPAGLLVLHTCGQRACVNPTHLYVGTELDNARDKTRDGTGTYHKGTANGNTKLTEAQVKEIKFRLSRGQVPRKIAPLYAVGVTTIVAIKTGRTWGWLNV